MIFYVDETAFNKHRSSGDKLIGIGYLMIDAPDPTRSIVESALERLRLDPDRKRVDRSPMDERTLEHGYFHAREDSANAHSSICRGISESLCARFEYTCQPLSLGEDVAWSTCLSSLMLATTGAPDPITMFVERRETEEVIRRNLDRARVLVHDAVDLFAYDKCTIPRFYPEIEIKVVGKSSEGVQVVDFLCWVQNRANFDPPDVVWRDRLGWSSSSSAGAPGEYIYQAGFVFGSPRQRQFDRYPESIFPLPELGAADDLASFGIEMLRTVCEFLFNSNPPTHEHIRRQFRPLKDTIESQRGMLSSDVLDGIARCYLRLFDMLPVYSGIGLDNSAEFARALQTKRLCGLILRKDLLNGVDTGRFLVQSLRHCIVIRSAHHPHERVS